MITNNLVWSIALCVLSTFNLNGQQSILSNGSNIISQGGSVSSSIGQISTEVISSNTDNLSPGVQQVYEISVHTGIETVFSEEIKVKTFPNPSSHFINLSSESEHTLSFKLTDINGQNLKIGQFKKMTTINLVDIPPSAYFLIISHQNQRIISYKIIKSSEK
ncbi:T9SS type A sorting domain-containing protein [Portibacter lacus]|uniref:Secretion system C-terminal sorting domain-containing protein n=1 Tax=Portibacter lacus TaxID=1099794 RepID=A0AA37WG88_9BACT|nr:T9SS type A sorting domain-containing protein [Portibacter lacus]GLR18164.1 hypothetical protein GCM10007940_27790 [Portibacter lacus]